VLCRAFSQYGNAMQVSRPVCLDHVVTASMIATNHSQLLIQTFYNSKTSSDHHIHVLSIEKRCHPSNNMLTNLDRLSVSARKRQLFEAVFVASNSTRNSVHFAIFIYAETTAGIERPADHWPSHKPPTASPTVSYNCRCVNNEGSCCVSSRYGYY
jgi:hypothetical protein